MIMMGLENPTLNEQNLSLLEKKIETNKADVSDYKRLELYLSSIGVARNYLINLLKEKGIESYEEFIFERNQSFEKKNRDVEGILLGYVLGAIGVLKKYTRTNNLR